MPDDDKSLQDDLAAAFDADEKAQNSGASDNGNPADSKPADGGSTPPALANSDEAKGPSKEVQPEVVETQSSSNETEQPVPGTPEPAPAAPSLDAPTHWALEHQEMFRGLDPKAQSFLLDRSKEMEAAHTKRSQEIAPLRNVAEQWTPYLQQFGATPDQVFNSLMQHEYGLRTGTNDQKIQILMGLAQSYGVDLGQNGNGQQAPSAEEDPFGVHERIQQAISPIQQQLQQLNGSFQQYQNGTQQSQQQAAQNSIDQFRDAKDDSGNLAHPYFAEVEGDMMALAQAQISRNQPVDIATLYESAIWSNPSVRAKLQAAQNHAAEQERRQKEQELARKQAAAAGGLAGGGSGTKEQPKSTEDAVRAAFAAAEAS